MEPLSSTMADTDELLRERIKRMQEEIDTNNAAAQRAQAEANFFEKKLAELEKLNPATNHELQAWKDWELMKASYVEIVKYKVRLTNLLIDDNR